MPPQKRWVRKKQADPRTIDALSTAINVSKPIATILAQRQITNFEEAKKYFRPQLSHLHDPLLIRDMDKAVARILKAIRENQKIMVFGDYDVDGTTAVALVYGFLNSFYFPTEFYIPDRYKEGYGISKAGIDYAKKNGFSLIIALDCGIKSIEFVEYASLQGIDFIICDHHRPGENIPRAVAVLDPKRNDCHYPFKELSGCGIGFKLVQAISAQLSHIKTDPLHYLDLVAVSIAADIVPIIEENRILAHYGLLRLASNPSPGLKALMHLAGIQNQITITSLVFGIAPRINAAGRIGHARQAVDLLLSQTPDEAYHFAAKLNDKNDLRRDVDASITEEALAMIEENKTHRQLKSTVLFKNDWHKGVIGIVASRCIETHYKPTIILTESNNKATGSARSVPGFDIYHAIEKCHDLLDRFGGHKYAAGLTMSLENIPAFREKFENVVSASITKEQLVPHIEIDTPLDFDNITPKFFRIIKQMEPFGPENMCPVFYTRNVTPASSLIILKEKHLKLALKQKGNKNIFGSIAFCKADFASSIEQNNTFDIAYTVTENEFRGITTLQLNIKDFRFQ